MRPSRRIGDKITENLARRGILEKSEFMKITIKVGGMHCEMCEARVKKAVLAAGADGCEASSKNGEVVVECDKDAIAGVKAAIYDAGFDVE